MQAAASWEISCPVVADLVWSEIDDPDHLQRAREDRSGRSCSSRGRTPGPVRVGIGAPRVNRRSPRPPGLHRRGIAGKLTLVGDPAADYGAYIYESQTHTLNRRCLLSRP